MGTERLRTAGVRIRVDPDLSYYAYPFGLDLLAKRDEVEVSRRQCLMSGTSSESIHSHDLYDPLAMPPKLVKAHDDLDRSVDSMFAPRRRNKFESDADRLSVLFERHKELTAPLLATKKR